MGYYSDSLGRWVATADVTVVASGQRTANGSSPAIELGDATAARLTLDVTAGLADADETLDVTVETSEDGATWRDVANFAQATDVGAVRASFSGLDRYIRASWTVAGTTPDVTFGVAGETV
jgi:hypothetical protein